MVFGKLVFSVFGKISDSSLVIMEEVLNIINGRVCLKWLFIKVF